MAPFFGFKGKPKTPDELVAKIKSSIQLLASSNKDKEVEKAGYDRFLPALARGSVSLGLQIKS
jgi:hypothetical protein